MYKIVIRIEYTNTLSADSQHGLSGPDSKGMEIHCMCLCCSHTVHMGHECFLPTAVWQVTLEEAEYILTYKPDGTFLVSERSGKPVSDPSSSSINTHYISVV